MAGISQGFRGFVEFGSVRALCRVPGAQHRMPRNLDVPEPISNQLGDINYADNVQFPTLSLPLVPMISPNTFWSTGTLQAWFFTRTSDDISAISAGITFADSADATGLGRWLITQPKGAGFRLQSSYGDNLGFIASFNGIDIDPASAAGLPATGLAGTPLEYDSVAFGGDLNGTGIIGFTLDYSTNLTPCPEMNGTLRPTEHNAGKPTAQLVLQTNHGGPLDDNAAGTIVAGGVTFNLPRLVCLNPVDRDQQAARVVRS